VSERTGPASTAPEPAISLLTPGGALRSHLGRWARWVGRHTGTTVLVVGGLLCLSGGALLGGLAAPVAVSLPGVHALRVDPTRTAARPAVKGSLVPGDSRSPTGRTALVVALPSRTLAATAAPPASPGTTARPGPATGGAHTTGSDTTSSSAARGTTGASPVTTTPGSTTPASSTTPAEDGSPSSGSADGTGGSPAASPPAETGGAGTGTSGSSSGTSGSSTGTGASGTDTGTGSATNSGTTGTRTTPTSPAPSSSGLGSLVTGLLGGF